MNGNNFFNFKSDDNSDHPAQIEANINESTLNFWVVIVFVGAAAVACAFGW
jgi:hypothetical protein